jgi:hypothetical protein
MLLPAGLKLQARMDCRSSMIDAGNASIVTGVLNILCTVTKIGYEKNRTHDPFLCPPEAL